VEAVGSEVKAVRNLQSKANCLQETGLSELTNLEATVRLWDLDYSVGILWTEWIVRLAIFCESEHLL